MAQPSPGLCYVTASSKDPSQLSDADLNKFYDDEHVPDILRYKFAKLALRYQSTKDSPVTGTGRYLALYPLDDARKLASPETKAMMDDLRISKVLGGRDHHDLIDYGVSAWTKVQDFDGPDPGSMVGRRAKTLVAVMIEPSSSGGEGGEEDVANWYRDEHFSMLSKCPHYVRGTRYQALGGTKFLALHEWDCEPQDLPEGEIQKTRETEWAKRVIGSAREMEREVWSLLGEWGEEGGRL